MNDAHKPRLSAEALSAAIIHMAHDITESEAFIGESLMLLKRSIGFDTAFVGGPCLGRSIMSDHESETWKPAALETLRGSSSRYEVMMNAVFGRSLTHGVCLDRDIYATAREFERSLYYQEVLRPADVSSLSCVGLTWRGSPLAFLVAARHGGRPMEGGFTAEDAELLSHVKCAFEAGLVANLATSQPSLLNQLTPREREIAEMICRGLSNREIGAILGTSPHTVRNQTVQIFRKLEVDNRVELTALLSGRSYGRADDLSVSRWVESFASRRAS